MTLSRRVLVATGLAPLLASIGPRQSLVTRSVPSTDAGMVLGVQTHFSQGWNLPWLDIARSVGAPSIRDGLSWASIETTPGVYKFDRYYVDFLEAARRKGIDVLLAVEPRHPAYDGGQTAFTAPAMAAYANYLAALLDRYPGLITAIEVGNEINGGGGMNGPAATNRAQSHVDLLRAVYSRVKPGHPNVAILGGSTNVIGVGFQERIFAAGGLEVMDGVAVHPYRSYAEHVDTELAALKAAMSRHGRVVPIHATEFSDKFKTPELASPHMVKMVALMGSSSVARAYWYALEEERWFPNMGLFTQRQTAKPAAETFAFLERTLIPLGDPVREPTDAMSFVYRYGRSATVIWGAPRSVDIAGPVQAYDSRGRVCDVPTKLADDPVILVGPAEVRLGRPEWLADSFYEFGKAHWSYFAQDGAGANHPLDWVYWDWTSYIGARPFRPLSFTPRTVAPAGDSRRPIKAVLRHRCETAGAVTVSLTVSHGGRNGDGVDVVLKHGDRTLQTLPLFADERTATVDVTRQAGDMIEMTVGPHLASGGDTVGYRMTILDRAPSPSLA